MIRFSPGSSNRVARRAGTLFLRGTNFSNFSARSACLQPRFHLLGILYWGDSHLVRGLILLQLFHHRNHGVECAEALRRECLNELAAYEYTHYGLKDERL